MAIAAHCRCCIHESPSSAIPIAADPGWMKVVCSYGGVFLRNPYCNVCLHYTSGESKLVYINSNSPLSSLVSALCSFFPAAGLDAASVALKCRLPGDHPDAVFDVPDEYALRIAIFESRRRAKKLPGLPEDIDRLRFFLTVTPPLPEPALSSCTADEESPLIDLSPPTPTNYTKPDDLPPEVMRLIEELKDGLMLRQAALGHDSPPPPPPLPPSRWLKSGRSSGEGRFPTWPGAVTRLLCDRTGRVVGSCTLDPTWQPNGVLVMGPQVF